MTARITPTCIITLGLLSGLVAVAVADSSLGEPQTHQNSTAPAGMVEDVLQDSDIEVPLGFLFSGESTTAELLLATYKGVGPATVTIMDLEPSTLYTLKVRSEEVTAEVYSTETGIAVFTLGHNHVKPVEVHREGRLVTVAIPPLVEPTSLNNVLSAPFCSPPHDIAAGKSDTGMCT